jgi:hypothetical protein
MSIDLYNNKYDRDFLKANIYNVKLIDILKTQDIDEEFIVRYILNEKYQLCDEDKVTINDVLIYKPYINFTRLTNLYYLYSSDDDSIIDFETYADNN